MNFVLAYFHESTAAFLTTWNRFWFAPRRHETLAAIRILTGLMIFYTHLVWSIDLFGFFGAAGRIDPQYAIDFHATAAGWSHWLWIESPQLLWAIHLLGLAVVFLFTLGLATRITSILTFLLTVSYAHRVPGALFGLDQINIFLAMYLMVGNSGYRYSLDQWLANRRGKLLPERTTLTNIAIRLIQLHMCIVYFFAAIGKLQGETWWAGQAMWLSLANYEYQTLDVTWLGKYPLVINFMTHVALLWELTYSFFIWPRFTRPLMLILAVPLHLGIAICMGMITFGSIMLVGNIAFVSSDLTAALVRCLVRKGRAGGAE